MKLISICILLLSTVVIFSCAMDKSYRTMPAERSTAVTSAEVETEQDSGKFTAISNAQPSASLAPMSDESKSIQVQATVPPSGIPVKASSETPPEVKQIERKIIRNGNFTIESKNPSEDQRKIASVAESLGGFVVTSEFKQTATASGSIVNVIVRVPSSQFDKAVTEILKTGSQVIYEKTSGKDVTEEYVDLEARLRAQHALENQYMEIMKRAGKISDVLEVQEKLTEVRTQIEQMEGRRRYLDNQASLSTINVTLQSPTAVVAATQNGFWRSIKNSFGDGVDVAVGIILGAVHFVVVALPVFILLILPLWFVLRFLNRRYNFMGRWKKEVTHPAPE